MITFYCSLVLFHTSSSSLFYVNPKRTVMDSSDLTSLYRVVVQFCKCIRKEHLSDPNTVSESVSRISWKLVALKI